MSFVVKSGQMIGETLARYRITARLGAGAMGEVYRAEDVRLRRTVALKVVRLTGDGDDASRRLLAEARAASSLSHPNIAVVYEVDEVDRDDGRVGYIAMEYVAGRTLADLASPEPLQLDTILDVGRQIALALADAHTHGLVHRDVKPSHVMLTESGLVKILDFGLAYWSSPAIDGSISTRTADLRDDSHRIVGTFPYMSPEQATGRPVDGRSDMFSLGTVLYELVSGRRPFDGKNMVQILAAVIHADPPPLGVRLVDLRLPAVEHIVRRMLEKDLPADLVIFAKSHRRWPPPRRARQTTMRTPAARGRFSRSPTFGISPPAQMTTGWERAFPRR
jgi:eukaryotic-like serine/threonine-protein kinase